jgi:xanthine dehydrogenase small subunit
MLEDLRRHLASPVYIHVSPVVAGSDLKRRTFYSPRSLEDALDFKALHSEATIVSGATELGVLGNKKGLHPAALLSLTNIPYLDQVSCEEDVVVIGANTTWTQIEALAKEILPEFYKIIVRFGSPQIRNVATLAANVAHGSPIADSLPFLMITDAELELVSRRGVRRAKINGFYKGYKAKDLAPDEIITKVIIPLPAADELLRLYKVSRRNDLDIATFGAGVRMKRAGDLITRAFISYSGVAATVVRLPETEAFLQGKLFSESTFREAGQVARTEIKPITDVRGSRDFRLQLAENILLKFYFDCTEPEPAEV